jgi:HEAT repeat protein
VQLEVEPAWARPIRNIVAMGEAAVPFVVIDLLEHGLPDRRDLGEQILADMGPEALPAWDFILESSNLRMRRMGMRALSEMSPGTAPLSYLEAGIADSDFGVRASAYRGLGRMGEGMAPRMRDALAREEDPFVRRAILESMSNFKDAASVEAVVIYLDRSMRAGDIDEARRADRVLQEMSGEKGSRDPAGWRAWIREAFDGS